MPTRSQGAIIKQVNEEVEKRKALEECMLRITEEVVDMRRRVEDMENVWLEQLDNRSEVSSIVSVPPRLSLIHI